MFSGIIKCLGKIETITDFGSSKSFVISSSISDSLSIDQSIAHDGVCLTVVKLEHGAHVVEVIQETLSKTAMGTYKEGQMINLEKSISAQTLLDGHLVQGHVDTTVTCTHISDLTGSWKFTFDLPNDFASLLIPQGSICINGVSLTVSSLSQTQFSVSVIPYTFNHTNFQYLKIGDAVNVEFDLIGKYIIRQMELRSIME